MADAGVNIEKVNSDMDEQQRTEVSFLRKSSKLYFMLKLHVPSQFVFLEWLIRTLNILGYRSRTSRHLKCLATFSFFIIFVVILFGTLTLKT